MAVRTIGADRKRRTTTISQATPTSAAAASARTNAIQYAMCHLVTAVPSIAAPNAPISP